MGVGENEEANCNLAIANERKIFAIFFSTKDHKKTYYLFITITKSLILKMKKISVLFCLLSLWNVTGKFSCRRTVVSYGHLCLRGGMGKLKGAQQQIKGKPGIDNGKNVEM